MSRQRRTRKNRQLSSLSEAERSKLQQLISGAEASETTQITEIVTQGELIPLTPAQKILWYAWKLDPKDTAYNLGGTLHFKGVLNAALVEQAFDYLCQTHDALRIKFFEDEAQDVWQLDVSHRSFRLYEAQAECRASRDEKLKAVVSKPFDLLIGQLLRVGLVTLNGDSSLVVTLHHIIADGTSMQQLLDEFVAIYVSLDAGHAVQVVQKQVGFLGFAKWLNKQDKTALYDSQLTVWRELLNGDDEPLGLPANNQARQQVHYKVSTATQLMGEDTWQQITLLANERNVTPYLIILTAWQLLLSRFANTDRVKVGVPVANRHMSETLNLIGFFVNTQVIPLSINNTDTFSQLLSQASQTSRSALGNQDLPFELLLKALNPERQTGVHPIFQVMFNYLRRDKSSLQQLGNVALDDYEFYRFGIPFDLQLDVIEDKAEGTILNLIYANELYNEEFATQCLATLDVLLKRVLRDIDSPLVNLPLLANAEVSQLHSLSQGKQSHPFIQPIHEVISAQSTKTPDAIAVRFADTLLSYAQLETKTNQLAHYLISQGVKAEDKVGVVFERSLEMVISLLGVIKAGAAYVPIDPNLPIDRVEYIAQSSGLALLLCDDSIQKLASLKAVASVCYFADIPLSAYASKATDRTIEPTQLAYAIYTSGSTGKPKGVGNTHEAIYNRIAWQQSAYPLTAADVVLQKTPFGFDVSVWEFFWPLMYGAQLVVAPPNAHKDSTQLLDIIIENNITTLHFVPSMLQAFIGHVDVRSATSIKHILCSGEALPSEVQATALEKLPNANVYNLYGPTEAAVDVSHFTCHGNTSLPVPIGEPIAGIQLYVLDHSLNLSPNRVAGELYIGGIGLARGYVNRPDLTAERFIANPFAGDGSRLYRTGDLVCWNTSGQLEYLGRTDHQVKIRGFRIELGEIEAGLYGISAVREAVVIADQGPSGQRLVAYVSGHNGADIDSKELQHALGERLPDYMVPSVIMVLPELPLSSNGKIDRKALPKVTISSDVDYCSPEGNVERTLANIWQAALNITQVGRFDNFFALGGDSIVGLQIIAKAKQHSLHFSAATLFEVQTIAALAQQVEVIVQPTIEQIVEGIVPLLPMQNAFFNTERINPDHYNQAIAIDLPTGTDAVVLKMALQAVIEKHDVLRSRFSKENNNWVQTYHASNADEAQECFDQLVCDQTQWVEHCEIKQASLSISKAHLHTVSLCNIEGLGNRLLWLAHHLIVDGVSWRVLLSDLAQAYQQIIVGQSVAIGLKTDSARSYMSSLHESELGNQVPYWLSQLSDTTVFSSDKLPATFGDSESLQVKLAAPMTKALIQDVGKPYNVKINDILLSALSVSLRPFSGEQAASIWLEGHGRTTHNTQLDVSQTAGWFTARYPVKLGVDDDLKSLLLAHKRIAHRVPEHGVGYGLLVDSKRISLTEHHKVLPDIEFNYLGQLDNMANPLGWVVSDAPVGSFIDARESLHVALMINAKIQHDQLVFDFVYDGNRISTTEANAIAEQLLLSCEQIVAHLQSAVAFLTVEDLPLVDITQDDLERLGLNLSEVSKVYPLSPMQKGMFFHGMQHQDSEAYINQTCLRVKRLDVTAFQDAWSHVISQHDVLRTGFINTAAQPLQFVYRANTPIWQQLDWRDRYREQATLLVAVAEYSDELRRKNFEFNDAQLMDLTLIQIADDEYIFIWTCHHLITDGWSSSALFGELLKAYKGDVLTPQNAQYQDYIAYLSQQDEAQSLAYWQQQLAPLSTPTYIHSTATSLSDMSLTSGYTQQLWCPVDLEVQKWRSFARDHGLTLNTLVQGAWALVLGHLCQQNHVCFGATTSGRPTTLTGIDTIQGMFINTMPIVVTLSDMQTVKWLGDLQQQNLASREHEFISLTTLQNRGASHIEQEQWGLFDSILVFENYPMSEALDALGNGGSEFSFLAAKEETTYPVTLSVILAEAVQFELSYQGHLLNTELAEKILSLLERALNSITELVSINEINLVDEQMAATLLDRGTEQIVALESVTLWHALYEQAEHHAAKTAVIYNEQKVEYGTLYHKAIQLGTLLSGKGITTGDRVALKMNKSVDWVIAQLAVFNIGATLVPIDPSLPVQRQLYILSDAQVRLLICEYAEVFTECEQWQYQAHNYTDITKCTETVMYSDALVAYIVYTSGSTGEPKGVMVSYKALAHHLFAAKMIYGYSETDISVMFASVGFDAAQEQLWLPLLSGASQILLDAKQTTPTALYEKMEACKATVLDCPPAYMQQMPQLPLTTRLCIVGGEAWLASDYLSLSEKNQHVQFVNAYGPTEAVITPTVWHSALHEAPTANYVAIGQALPGRSVFILDQHLNLLESGQVGELYIGGELLAQGYVNRAGQTAERFIANPFSDHGERLYRTGDLVRWNRAAELEYVSRIDHQVKIRGFRIELGEIEALLMAQDGVVNALVIADNSGHSSRLIAYVAGANLSDVKLMDALSQALPEYMLPSHIIIMSSMPTNQNGKIDRAQLSLPVLENALQFIAPRTKKEQVLAGLWQQILGCNEVSTTDNFFTSGGDSISSLRLIGSAQEAGYQLSIKDIFAEPVLHIMAELMREDAQNNLTIIRNIERYSGLSYAQQRQWFLWKLDSQSSAYHISGSLVLSGSLDESACHIALQYIYKKHSVLRSIFSEAEDGTPRQSLLPDSNLQVELVDLTSRENTQTLESLKSSWKNTPFNLTQSGAFRVGLVRTALNVYELVVVMHHIVADGWSISMIVQDFMTIYEACIVGRELPSISVDLDYSDFALWQQQHVDNVQSEQLQYWQEILGSEHPELVLPKDLTTSQQNLTSAKQEIVLCEQQLQKLSQQADTLGVTTFGMLLAAWQVFLYRVTGQSDIRTGMPIANRHIAGIQNMVGLFVNTQVIKTQFSGAESLQDVVSAVTDALHGAQLNQDIPFEKLLDNLDVSRESEHPLFQVMINHQKIQSSEVVSLSGLNVSEGELPAGNAQFSLILNILEDQDGHISCDLEYAKEQFSTQRIASFATGYQQILAELINNTHESVTNIAVLPANTTADILALGKAQVCDWEPTLAHQIIVEKALQGGEKSALVCNEVTLSYAMLTHRVAQFAHYLRAQGVGHETPIGIACIRSHDMVIALLGAWQIGACVIPMEPDLPAERFTQINAQSELALLISDGHFAHTSTVPVIDISTCDYQQLAGSDTPLVIHPQQTAYVIYTSGSTGVPKGVAVSHEALTQHCQAMQHSYQLTSQDSCVLFASLSFDAGLEQLLVPLMSGSKVVIVDAKQTTPNDFNALCHNQNITTVDLPSVYLKQLAPLPNVRLGIVGGEAWSKHDFEHAQQQLPNATLVNAYGPTEAVITPTLWRGDARTQVNSAYVPIGRAVGQRCLYILDAQLNLLTAGMTGELYIGGSALARGYVGRADFTAERFIANPFADTGERIYRTGDLARWNELGELEYVGRIDHQVKIRGFRVELGEVEAALNAQAGIDSSLVMVDNSGEHARLVAYVVGAQVDEAQLRQAIAEQLPQYMVPQTIMVLTRWPTTVNGKIDRKALPEANYVVQSEFVEPEGKVERVLAVIWSELFSQESISRLDNFFALGGDSITSLRFIAMAKKAEVYLDIADVFKAHNLQALALLANTQTPEKLQPLARLEPTYSGLSYAQQRQWFLWKLAPDSDAYHISGGLMLRGQLDMHALQSALDHVVAKHSALRTRFHDDSTGNVTQFVQAHTACHISTLTASASANEKHILRKGLVSKPFDLANELLYRIAVIAHDDEQHELIVVMHHIISDGWSMNLIINDFVLGYKAAKQQQTLIIDDLTARYSDYAKWQKSWLEDGAEQRQLTYWHSVLGDEHPVLALPTDLDSTEQEYHSAELSFDIESSLQELLVLVAKRHETTLFSVLMAAWHVLLQRVSGQPEVRVGMPIANRQHADTQDMVGFFVNTQIIKTHMTGAETLDDVMALIVTALQGAQANQDLPFEKLVNSFELDRSMGDNALFQVMMNHQRQEDDNLATLPGLDIVETQLPNTSAQFALVLNVLEAPNKPVNIGFEYAVELFSAQRMKMLVDGYRTILTSFAENSHESVANIAVLSANTTANILALGQEQVRDWSATLTHQIITEQAAQNRDKVALVCNEDTLNYAALAHRVAQFAQYLRSMGINHETPVGIACSRSLDMVIALLGAWQAGACVIPMEPDLPAERFTQINAQSELALLISDGHFAHTSTVPMIDITACDYQQLGGSGTPLVIHPQQTAYVIYTSGSTGVPKGVAVSHEALTHHCQAMQHNYQLTPQDSCVLFASLSFDAGLEQLLVPLMAGSKVVIVDAKQTTPNDFNALCQAQNITAVDLPSVYLKQLAPLPNVRLCIVGGEAWSKHDFESAQQQLPNASLVNAYGPTEAVITPTLWRGDAGTHVSSAYVPIGRAVGQRGLYILDAQLNLLTTGMTGELYIGGPALARGYVGRADFTAERFIANPFVDTGERLYRTGDLARWNELGELEYVGRIDHQVKIRGFRVELGEVEAVLNAQAGIDSSLVMVDNSAEHARLVAYVVGELVNEAQLRQAIAEQLPQYMVPHAIMVLTCWPTTVNGKIDRKALPDVTFASDRDYEAPVGEVENQLAMIWAEVLSSSDIGRLDNFFLLGGDSISALRVVSRVEQALSVNCPVKLMFEAPVLAQLAIKVTALEATTKPNLVPVERTELHELSPAQLSLWLNDQLTDSPQDKQAYNISGGVSLVGDVCVETLQSAFDATIARHETLRMQFIDNLGDASVEILPKVMFDLPLHDLSQLESELAQQRAKELQTELEHAIFDLTKAPLIKACLVKLADVHHLYVNLHHIIADGWSIGVLVQDLGLAYQGLLEGAVPGWSALPIQYVDYAAWQQAQLSGLQGEDTRQFWRQSLASAPANSALPPHFPRPEQISSDGASVELSFDETQTAQIKAFAKSRNISLHTVLLSAYQLFLHAVTAKDDVIIGSDLAGRDHPDLELLIGFFIRVLPQRSIVDPNQILIDYLAATQAHSLDMVEHQALGLEALIELSQVDRIQGVQPLVQQLFVMQNTPQETWPVAGLSLEPLESKGAINSKFDSALFVMDENELQCSWVFRKQLYNANIMQQLLGRWQQCVMQLITESEKTIRDLLSPMTQDIKTMQKATQGKKFSGLKKGLKKRSVKKAPTIKTRFLPDTESFPVIIEPSTADLDPIAWAEQNRDVIDQHLNQSAGIIFRNFALATPQDFEKFADAIQPGLYGQYGDLPKKEGGKKTYKSTPYPEKQMILYHNESAHLSKWPRKQWFFCELPSVVGGATPIVDCRRMLQVLPADIVEKFSTKGLLYVRNFIKNLDVSWQDFYKTDSKQEVESLLHASNTEFKWLDNDGLQTRTKTHGVIAHPITGARSFFNQVQLHHESCLAPDVRSDLIAMVGQDLLPRNVFYGDGSAISYEEMAIIGEAYEHCAVRFDWQKGDVVMVDNMLAAHARDPYEGPRKIVVAMGDMVNQADLASAKVYESGETA
ncbi:amino acid adenylation domain-containing protein [Pseudoalteromonas sp. NEC-BIFX-2020_002]|uniref:non-ribosomal peptide synthetase n=1 Tax=Pseudoalteromonas sp. NEC-BIFX-2020_002 TaxID=2732353 RepID=UPI001476F0F9|nr:non-ribosomal peptide synthetase [Pseudoalteromonas sp. NEC-BIFX-2020_002]NNG41645.1 amino acid adenylation domain-containing protein [Pseudoalteromonas sp. NEC-BIFX-2020_002]